MHYLPKFRSSSSPCGTLQFSFPSSHRVQRCLYNHLASCLWTNDPPVCYRLLAALLSFNTLGFPRLVAGDSTSLPFSDHGAIQVRLGKEGNFQKISKLREDPASTGSREKGKKRERGRKISKTEGGKRGEKRNKNYSRHFFFVVLNTFWARPNCPRVGREKGFIRKPGQFLPPSA